jgi:hypothetical protein
MIELKTNEGRAGNYPKMKDTLIGYIGHHDFKWNILDLWKWLQ